MKDTLALHHIESVLFMPSGTKKENCGLFQGCNESLESGIGSTGTSPSHGPITVYESLGGQGSRKAPFTFA